MNEKERSQGGMITGYTTSKDYARLAELIKTREVVCIIPETNTSVAYSKTDRDGTAKPGAFQLNPSFSRWLMGFPVEWDYCGATAMQSCRKLRRSLSKQSAK